MNILTKKCYNHVVFLYLLRLAISDMISWKESDARIVFSYLMESLTQINFKMLVVRRKKTDWKCLYTFAILVTKFSGIWIKIGYVDIQRSCKWWSKKDLLDIQNVRGAVTTCAKSTVIVLFLPSDWNMLFSDQNKLLKIRNTSPPSPIQQNNQNCSGPGMMMEQSPKLKNATMWLLSLAMLHSNVPKDNNIILSCFKFCFWLKYN